MIGQISGIIDILAFFIVILCSVFSFKMYKLNPIDQLLFLFIGFVLLIITRFGFIIINYLPIGEEIAVNRFIGESMVALAIIPYGFILMGLYHLYKIMKIFLCGDEDEPSEG